VFIAMLFVRFHLMIRDFFAGHSVYL